MAKKKGGKGRRPNPAQSRNRPANRPANRPEATAAKSVGGTGAAKVTRAERIEAAQKARRRRSLLTRTIIAVVVAAVISGIASLVSSDRRSTQKSIDRMEAGGCRFDRKADGDAGTGRNHVLDPSYRVNPPSGGDHLVNAAGPGIYTAETMPPDGQVVHSQEHGYVILWYRPDLPEEQITELRGITSRYSKDVLLVPRPSLPVPVAGTAWHRRLLCKKSDAKALDLFVTTYRNEGPEKVAHG